MRERAGEKPALDTAVMILAGGRSSRMGQDKCALTLGGRSFLEIAESRTQGFPLRLLSCGKETLSLPGFVTVQDDMPACGPIGGIVSCLRYSPLPWLLVLPCDMPLLTADALWHLMARRDDGSDYLFFSESGKLRAMPALLRAAPARRFLERAAAQGQFCFGRLLAQQTRARGVPVETLTGGGLILRNINTPEDYRRLRGTEKPPVSVCAQPSVARKGRIAYDTDQFEAGTAQI